MKAKIVTSSYPELKPGQIWKRKDSGDIYIAVRSGAIAKIMLVTSDFGNVWSSQGGFGDWDASSDGWEYVCELKLEK